MGGAWMDIVRVAIVRLRRNLARPFYDKPNNLASGYVDINAAHGVGGSVALVEADGLQHQVAKGPPQSRVWDEGKRKVPAKPGRQTGFRLSGGNSPCTARRGPGWA